MLRVVHDSSADESQPNGASQVGTKAAGLLTVPDPWRLPLLVIAPGTVVPADAALLSQRHLDRFAGVRHVIVRSNGPSEDQRPGERSSVVVPTTLAAISYAIELLLAAQTRGDVILPLLQGAITPVMLGVLSNERRLTAWANRCVAEGPLSLGAEEQQDVHAMSCYSRDPLWASTVDELRLRLSEIASLMQSRAERIRCEWGWDGERLWVLQFDAVASHGDPLSGTLLSSAEPGSRIPSLPITGPGRKVAKTRLFAELGLPFLGSVVVPLEMATHERVTQALGDNDAMPTKQRPVVVRTEILDHDDGLLLPTSGPCTSVAEIMGFVSQTSTAHSAQASESAPVLLLLAPLVDARASTITYASPDSTTPCEIHAAWGFPDGLLSLPHDSAQVSVDGKITNRQTVYKPAGLFPTSARWRMLRIGAPWDWQQVLNDDELRQLAAWARKVALREDAPVQLMALARVAGQRGGQACLPFHYTTLRASESSAIGDVREAVVVRTPADLDALKERKARGEALELRLASQWLRDSRLLRRIGALAVERDAPVLYSGSRLSHAFYILAGTGAAIVDCAYEDSSPHQATRARRYAYLADLDGFKRVRTEEGATLYRLAERQLEASHNDSALAVESRITIARVRQTLSHELQPTCLADLPVLHNALLESELVDRQEPPVVLSTSVSPSRRYRALSRSQARPS
jgi:hypothetical protein